MTQPLPASQGPEVLLVTGMSGAGRSTVGKVLEDIGYVVVDNLPLPLLDDVVRLHDVAEGATRLAATVDVRTGLDAAELRHAVRMLRREGIAPMVVFLDAADETLATRYDEVRRPHPVAGATVLESIAAERASLTEIREGADVVIDTTSYNVHDLRRRIETEFSKGRGPKRLRVSVRSFGFKHGHPHDVDMLFDVRFLPNPHWQPELRPQTGQDAPVRDYVLENPATQEFLSHAEGMLEFLLPRFSAEGKTYLSLGIGCTGGRHRSVAIAEELGRRLGEREVIVSVQHRDLER
jgi:UPF0042 nucleotide-binding protein